MQEHGAVYRSRHVRQNTITIHRSAACVDLLSLCGITPRRQIALAVSARVISRSSGHCFLFNRRRVSRRFYHDICLNNWLLSYAEQTAVA
jgi:hypothetical protein